MTFSITFEMDLPKTSISKFVLGTLILKSQRTVGGIKLQASSGLPSYQYRHSWLLKGRGCIPPSISLDSLRYSVSTQRLNMPGVKGVEGGFYAIAPFSVPVGQITRGDFGCHRDAGVKGSAGCIIFPLGDHWEMFEDWMLDKRLAKVQSIPLEVIYH